MEGSFDIEADALRDTHDEVVEALADSADDAIVTHSDFLARAASRICSWDLDQVQEQSESIRQIVGGVAGCNWFADFQVPEGTPEKQAVLEWFNRTLGQANTVQMEQHLAKTAAAISRQFQSNADTLVISKFFVFRMPVYA